MAFILRCPNCGERSVTDFRFGGEALHRPAYGAPADEWTGYFYNRRNELGIQREWWYHKLGCHQWFLARRDTATNNVVETFWPEGPPGQ